MAQFLSLVRYFVRIITFRMITSILKKEIDINLRLLYDKRILHSENYILNIFYPERWRDWPYETSATLLCQFQQAPA